MVKLKATKNLLKEINELVNISLASAKIRKLVLQEEKSDKNIRPSIHLLLISPIGSLKSTLLEAIGSEVNQTVMTEITQAGLIGTIDKGTHQVIPAKVWECRNSLLLIDEFKIARYDWQVFLQLLESQTWAKKIGLFSVGLNETDGDLFFRVNSGNIELKTRFASIIATMKRLEYQRGQGFRAFVSRCIPYVYSFDSTDIDNILTGISLFDKKEFSVKQEVIIKKKDYKKIRSFVSKEIIKIKCPEFHKNELKMRTVCDCCRIFAVFGKHNLTWYKRFIKWKFEAYNKIGAYYKEDENGEK